MSQVFTKEMPKQPVTLATPKSARISTGSGGPMNVKGVPLSPASVRQSVSRGCCGAKQR